MSRPDAPVRVQGLSYATPAAPTPTISWLAFFSSSVVVGLVALVLLFLVPGLKQIYMDFHLKLPAPTVGLLEVSDWAVRWGWMSFPIFPVAFALITPRFAPRPKVHTVPEYATKVKRLTALALVLCAALVVLLITAMCGFMPMITIMEGISK